jgi:predicted nucleotidyltransferase
MKILVKAIAGSHLFGTATPQSDQDFKGIFLPSSDDILLGKFDQTLPKKEQKAAGQKNTKDDIDEEFYSLDKFLKMLYQGQTVALELLFTPDHMILEQHPLWKTIQAAAPYLISRNCKAFIGYTQTQAARYGIRGSRMETLEKVILILRQYHKNPNWHYTLKEIAHFDQEYFKSLEHVQFTTDKNNKELIVICGKKFGWDTKLSYVLDPLEKYYKEYGERSRLAKENLGIDFKALSHSVRVSMQALSLLTTGSIQLPMSPENVTLLKDIKAGKYDYLTVAGFIEDHLDRVLEAQKTSNLPEVADLEAFQAIQKRIYTMVIKGEV